MTQEGRWIAPPPKRFHDWVGTCGLQEDIALGRRLVELAGLDAQRWMVVGFTIYPNCGGDSTTETVEIYAVDKGVWGTRNDLETMTTIRRYAEEHHGVSVCAFHVPGLDMKTVLAQMKYGFLHLHAASLRDYPIHISDRATIT